MDIRKIIRNILSEQLFSERITINDDVENFFKTNNFEYDNLSYLGSGDFGEAYSIGDGRALKLTSSKSEFDIAKSLIGKNGSLDGIVDFYAAEIIDGQMFIIMEELGEDSDIENLYYELSEMLESQGLPIQYVHMFDEDDYDGEVSDDIREFISDIEDINSAYRSLDIEASDIRPENMGRDKNSKVKAFDIEDKKHGKGIW